MVSELGNILSEHDFNKINRKRFNKRMLLLNTTGCGGLMLM